MNKNIHLVYNLYSEFPIPNVLNHATFRYFSDLEEFMKDHRVDDFFVIIGDDLDTDSYNKLQRLTNLQDI